MNGKDKKRPYHNYKEIFFMKIQNVNDTSFKKYGKILKGYPADKILKEMQHTPLPDDVIYVPSVDTLEATNDAKVFKEKGFGGLEIQIGYCNGNNHKLNGLEYHRSSEINIAVYATTLHYAPCNAEGEKGFRCVVILPKGTNEDLTFTPDKDGEDKLLTAQNKWLIAHEEAEIPGAFCGLVGENITLK